MTTTTVDIHTHVYPPSYIRILESRTTVPLIRCLTPASTPRLVILPGEDASASTSAGRPIGPEYSDITVKLSFMRTHDIKISVISLANPWLDFLSASAAADAAIEVNNDLSSMCASSPGRLFFFGVLPVSAGADTCVQELQRIMEMRFCRGVILGTGGLGKGLDDPAMEALWTALSETGTTMFLHPHYGLPGELYGSGQYGHVLPLAVGFPVETTIAVARMWLGGVFDRHEGLQLLLAHSGGVLPFLKGRLESCVLHDGFLVNEGKRPKRGLDEVLKKNLLLDAVIYSADPLKLAVDTVGADRVLFGTDHPFFPPLEGEEKKGGNWASVGSNVAAVKTAFGGTKEAAEQILGGNAVQILKLK